MNMDTNFHNDLGYWIKNNMRGIAWKQELTGHYYWYVKYAHKGVWIFGITNNSEAKIVANRLFELYSTKLLSYLFFVVYENWEHIDCTNFLLNTKYADNQYLTLNDFISTTINDVKRMSNCPY